MARISVIGSGTWGMALSLLLNSNNHDVIVWSALPDEVEMLKNKRVHNNLPGVDIPEEIEITGDLEYAVKSGELLVLSVPSVFTRQTASKMKDYVAEGQIIVNVAKGIEEDTLMTLSEQIEDEIPQADVAVLSGPSHAEEVSRGIPTTCVVGAKTRSTAEFIQNIFMRDNFRVYTSPDVLGIELGGSLKNVVALAAGVADGLGYGDNTKAALITRGLAEMSRLALKMGAKAETLYGLSGMGDLIVTCASMHSRNRRAGMLIGQGKTMQEAMEEVHMVVEGVYSAKAALALSKKYDVTMPITEAINKVLFDGKSASDAVNELMTRDKGIENQLLPWGKE